MQWTLDGTGAEDKYDSSLAVFGVRYADNGNPKTVKLALLGQRYRKNGAMPKVIFNDISQSIENPIATSYEWHFEDVAACESPVTTRGNAPPMYVAASASIKSSSQSSRTYDDTKLRVYRYNPSTETYTPLAKLELTADANTGWGIHKVALAARGDDLYVFWQEEKLSSGSAYNRIVGQWIEDAGTITPSPVITLSGTSLVTLKDQGSNPLHGEETILKVDWDEKVMTSASTFEALPRIVYMHDSEFPDPDGYQEIRAARVELNGDNIDVLSNNTMLTEDTDTESGYYPALAVNRKDSRFTTSDIVDRVFCRYVYAGGSDLIKPQNMDYNTGTWGDSWGTETPDQSGELSPPGLAARAFGLDRLSFIVIGGAGEECHEASTGYFSRLIPNAGSALEGQFTDPDFYENSSIHAQESNRDNLYLSYCLNNAGKIRHLEILQIAP